MISTESIFFEVPLYQSLIDGQDFDSADAFAYGTRVDSYNIDLKENTTYSVQVSYGGRTNLYEVAVNGGGYFEAVLTCARTRKILKFFFYCFPNSKKIIKVGQYPSIADLHVGRIKQYDKVLSKEKLKEFTRAIGLAANGVGIGSFVYLRRIFEGLIEEEHLKAKVKNDWVEEVYQHSRMNEKIVQLKDYLPSFLVENKELYSILSVGIHSLNEDECLAYYETVKVGIELILEEKAEVLEKQKKIEEAKNKITQLKSSLTIQTKA